MSSKNSVVSIFPNQDQAEAAIKTEQFVLVVDGAHEDLSTAERILSGTSATKTTLHTAPALAA
jgi:hypothetical protein